MKKMCLALALGCSLVGCGGGGGASGDVVDQWVDSLMSSFASENISLYASLISDSYLDSCDTKATLLSGAANTFAQATSISISEVNITSKVINEQTGIAVVAATYRIKITTPTGVIERVESESTYLGRENGVWRDIGNQVCL